MEHGQFDPSQGMGGDSPRHVSGGAQQSFAYVGYSQDPRGNIRPSSASPTSSLSGAMGDAHISSTSQMPGTVPSGMTWPVHSAYTDEAQMASYISTPPTPASASPSGTFSVYSIQPYNQPNPNHDIYGQNIPSPSIYAEQQFASQQARSQMLHAMTPSPTTPSSAMTLPTNPMPAINRTSRPSRESLEDEIHRLRQRVMELENAREVEVQRTHHLQQELNRITYGLSAPASGSALPSPLPTPTYPPALEESWRRRTDARRKIFCSVNRAGNALCAWHDSRRERRAFPPRNAPLGMLNCGCTFEEALFEESLARHNVGSYHPGESVRMDPALRNPLLKLLQERYGYRDGDFDFDPVTRTWQNGEDATYWEQKLAAGAANSRRARAEERR